MAKDPNGTDPRPSGDARPVYESPQVLRLGDVHRGEGACSPGSGDSSSPCSTGNIAAGACGNGNGALAPCIPLGSGFV